MSIFCTKCCVLVRVLKSEFNIKYLTLTYNEILFRKLRASRFNRNILNSKWKIAKNFCLVLFYIQKFIWIYTNRTKLFREFYGEFENILIQFLCIDPIIFDRSKKYICDDIIAIVIIHVFHIWRDNILNKIRYIGHLIYYFGDIKQGLQ